jgi:hypothetical protein
MMVTHRNVIILRWNQSGKNFDGPLNEQTEIVDGHLSKEKPILGGVYSITHQWIITSGTSKLDAIIQVFYQFRTKKETVNKIHLYGLSKDSARTATEKLNAELVEKNLDIPARNELPIVRDGWLDEFFERILRKVYV